MILCRTITPLHTAAREGTLTGVARVGYRVHMAICPFCRAYARGLEQVVDALGALPEESAPESIKSQAIARLRARADSSSRDRSTGAGALPAPVNWAAPRWSSGNLRRRHAAYTIHGMPSDDRRTYTVNCLACGTKLTTVRRDDTPTHDRLRRDGLMCGTCKVVVKGLQFVLGPT